MESKSKSYSAVWDYFKIKDDDSAKVICKLCDKQLSRGRSDRPKDFSTSPMRNHLRLMHRESFDEMMGKKTSLEASVLANTSVMNLGQSGHCLLKASSNTQQSSLQALERSKTWDINSLNAKRIHAAVARMIAMDMESFEVVERPGFRELMHSMEKRYELPSGKYFAEHVIPDMCKRVKEKIAAMLSDTDHISFTTNTWTAEHTTQSFMGITGHWLTDSFAHRNVVLHCTALDEHHTDTDLLAHFEVMLDEWSIAREKCHVIVRDNAFNIAKCFRDVSYSSVGCFAHTLQLCVHDGLLSQKYVADIINTGRELVEHFKYSSSATSRLHELQNELNLQQHHQLIQDETTRWNSTLYMLRRLLEQRHSISLYCDIDSVTGLTEQQWAVMENVVATLAPFEEITQEISSSQALISVVIPLVKTLMVFLQKEGSDAVIKTMKAALFEAVSSRFADIESKSIYTCATLLDPRFKLCFFSERGRSDARAHLLLAANSIIDSSNRVSPQDQSATSSSSSTSVLTCVSNATPYECSLWSCYDTFVEENTTKDHSASPEVNNINIEVTQYLLEPLQARQSDPVSWWHANKQRFPNMARLAQAFLAPPPTSVPSERLFSTAGDIVTDHRCRILPQNAETLIFLKYNASLLDSESSTSQP